MCGSILEDMRRTDVFDRLFHGHVAAVDVLRPNVTDPLFAFQIILGHVLHCDRSVLEVFYLPAVIILALVSGVEYYEAQYCCYYDNIDYND